VRPRFPAWVLPLVQLLLVLLLIAVVLNYFGRDTLNDLIKKEQKGDQGAVVA